MNIQVAEAATTYLLLLLMLIQTSELYVLNRHPRFQKVWNIRNLFDDLDAGLPLSRKVIHSVFSEKTLTIWLTVSLGLIPLAALTQDRYLFVFLFVYHLFVCIRFRGTFNGGSDMMTFVVLTGLLVCKFGYPREGLIYISIHTLYSYFKAGISKMIHREWLDGTALPIFLRRSHNPKIHVVSAWLLGRKHLCRVLTLAVLAFELSAILLIFFPYFGTMYFILAVAFHFSIYLAFGLNRFLWAWLSAWPATLYSLYSLGGT